MTDKRVTDKREPSKKKSQLGLFLSSMFSNHYTESSGGRARPDSSLTRFPNRFPKKPKSLEILSHVFLRASELSNAKWEEVDFDNNVWTIPAERMKGTKGRRTELLVPLSKQVKTLLLSLKNLNYSEVYIFPQTTHGRVKPNEPISSVSMNNALNALGYKDKHTAHGFRASFRTIGDEILGFDFEGMELQLHHALQNVPNGRAYGRYGKFEIRREIMNNWSDWLDMCYRS